MNKTIHPVKGLKGEVTIPGDKSISHRSIMFGALADGLTEITGFLEGADCLSTIDCFRKMGIRIDRAGSNISVYGKGLDGLSKPSSILDTGNSGTTTRLISGILAGQSFETELNGDESIQKRPMKRIMTPLQMMGADITSVRGNDCAPLSIKPAKLNGIDYNSPVSSAQVKSCVLLAGLYADSPTSVTEPVLSRNHTELMLNGFGANVTSCGTKATILPRPNLYGQKIEVPGDISSAAYFIVAGAITPNSEILIKNVGINPTRDGILRVALDMGANIEKLNERTVSGESVCDLYVKTSTLHGTVVEGDIIPTLIDEIPVIAVMAAFADGQTIIKDAAELKVKESNRIDTVTEALRALGCDITPTDDGMIINGGNSLHKATINSYKDHRIAMSFAICALASDEPIEIIDADCVDISYPEFYKTVDQISI